MVDLIGVGEVYFTLGEGAPQGAEGSVAPVPGDEEGDPVRQRSTPRGPPS
ncbi:hypothetical protein IC006_2411 [Sulfuracidifex tepidarius]|uniref:Uncharacterized protein n=1 Tax=Sulfuracidifex tepidarius TaxID=1294262 RepID=A0A510E716_9CREN|nr:hypothetical protein IC006_2411 [Sulfuracidifex tepidarius]BBG27858.1 hypothetical protein IC007_2413 [Sulfuracidifex tepidarius]